MGAVGQLDKSHQVRPPKKKLQHQSSQPGPEHIHLYRLNGPFTFTCPGIQDLQSMAGSMALPSCRAVLLSLWTWVLIHMTFLQQASAQNDTIPKNSTWENTNPNTSADGTVEGRRWVVIVDITLLVRCARGVGHTACLLTWKSLTTKRHMMTYRARLWLAQASF